MTAIVGRGGRRTIRNRQPIMGSLTRANAARSAAKGVGAGKPNTTKGHQIQTVTLGERLEYGFDKAMAGGPVALVGCSA